MSCLLPQFKCQPDTFSIHFKTHQPHPQLSRIKEPNCLRTQCTLSTASPSPSMAMTVLDLEKLRLPSLEAPSDPLAANRPWPYMGPMASPSEVRFGSTLATETLITSDEAVIAAAAAEAVALARAAVKVSKDVALMVNNTCSLKAETKTSLSSTDDSCSSRWPRLTEAERASILQDSTESKTEEISESSLESSSEELGFLEPTDEELTLLEEQLVNGITVRSNRHTERKAKRARAAKKTAVTVVSVKSGSTSKKKRAAMQNVDHYDPLHYLRGTTSSSRLLTFKEEIDLSKGIQDLLKLERLHQDLAERCGVDPTFEQWAAAAAVDQKTLRKRLDYGIRCKDRMIKSNIRLVISIAKNYQGAGLNLQDLVQEGCRGLVKGAEKFDASKGFKFSTYAHWWIKQSVRKSLSDQSRTIRLPFHMVEATYRVKEAKKRLCTQNGRQPNDEEVAEATGLSMKRLSSVLMVPKRPVSLDQKMGQNMDIKASEVIANPTAESTEALLMKQFMKQDLEKVLNSLSPRENQVIRWRFGFEDGRMKTLQEIGEMIGVSRERIRQIELSAFRKLKNKRRTKLLKQYVIP